MENTKDESHAMYQAKAQLRSIIAMVAALNVDYDRLEELREEIENFAVNMPEDKGHTIQEIRETWEKANPDEATELAELEEQANGCKDYDEAYEAIENDPLEIQVRSDWHSPGDSDNTPTEFYILLCTGGPAVRIMGELSQGEPSRAWIEYQDWFTPWTELVYEYGSGQADAVLEYCRQFYFCDV